MEIRMTMAMMMLTMGSMTYQPVKEMMIPEMTTPTDTNVSATMWRKAPRTFMSFFWPFISSTTVRPLMRIPTPAVHDTTAPLISAGS